MKTVTVMVPVQLDVENLDNVQNNVVATLNLMNEIIGMSELNAQPQIVVKGISNIDTNRIQSLAWFIDRIGRDIKYIPIEGLDGANGQSIEVLSVEHATNLENCQNFGYRFVSDDEYNMDAAAVLLYEDEKTLEEQIAAIDEHPNPDDLIDHVEGVTVWEKVEFSLTCKEFMETVTK